MSGDHCFSVPPKRASLSAIRPGPDLLPACHRETGTGLPRSWETTEGTEPMASNDEKLAAVREFAARELLQILTKAYDDGISPYGNPLVAKFVAVANAAEIAREALDQYNEIKPDTGLKTDEFDPTAKN